MATGYVRGSIENSGGPGNETNSPTLSTKKVFFPVQEFEANLNPDPLTRDDENRNTDQPVAAVPGEYGPDWSCDMRLYPDSVGFFLRLLLGDPVTTAGNGVITDPDSIAIPAGAHRHVWTAPFGPTGTNPRTAQFDVAYKDQSAYYLLKGAAIQEFTVENPEGAGGSNMSISGPTAYLNSQADPALTATYEALTIRPFRRGNLSVPTWLAGSGTFDNIGLEVARAIEPVRSLGIASKWPDTIEYSNDPISTIITGTAEKRFLDSDDWTALRDATGFAAKIRWLSDTVIASSYPYKLFVEFTNCQYTEGGPEPLGNKRRHGATFGFRGTSSDGATASTTLTLVNATASYS